MNNPPDDERTSRDDAFLANLYARAEEEIIPTHPDYDPDEGLDRFLTQIGDSTDADKTLDTPVESFSVGVPETIPPVTKAQFGEAFRGLLEAAGLSVDQVLQDVQQAGVNRLSRSTLYGWKNGRHLPEDANVLLAAVRVCQAAATRRGMRLRPQVPPNDAAWVRLLAAAKAAPYGQLRAGKEASLRPLITVPLSGRVTRAARRYWFLPIWSSD